MLDGFGSFAFYEQGYGFSVFALGDKGGTALRGLFRGALRTYDLAREGLALSSASAVNAVKPKANAIVVMYFIAMIVLPAQTERNDPRRTAY